MRRWRALRDADEGQVIILFALFSIVLIGVLALAIDAGYLLSERRQAQAAADAASLAGASAMLNGADDDEIEATVNAYLRDNGIDLATATVNVKITGDAEEGEVYVDVQVPVQRFFLGAVYAGAWETGAEATSAIEDDGPADYALLALDETGDPITVTGNNDVDILGGGAMSNGGARCTGNGDFHAEMTVDAHTGFTEIGNCEFIGDQGKNGNAPIIVDPLAHVPPPGKPAAPAPPGGDGVACDPSNSSSGNGNTHSCPPGVYTSDIQVTGNNGTADFYGNSYYFAAGVDIRMTGNNPSVEFGNAGGDNIFYFESGQLRLTGNNPRVTFWPGAYYFGPGGAFTLTGNEPTIEFKPGHYVFYMNDSDFAFTGNSLAIYPDANDVYFYFENADFIATGNANNTTIPPGIYHFNNSDIKMTGNSRIYGDDVFFFLDNGSEWKVTGNSQFRLTASETALYTGMHPGMLIYSARDNETLFKWTGNANTFTRGVIYLPAAEFEITGNFSGLFAEGQIIVDRFKATGNINGELQFREYVDLTVPAVWLIE